MPFQTAKKINDSFYADECNVFIPYGPLGIGKSAYATKIIAELYAVNGVPNWEAVKTHLVFHPRDFVSMCCKMMDQKKKDKALIWDDAGLWLFALESHHPFIKAVIKYLNVARTNWAALIFTTPLPTWVIKKIRGFPQAITLKILKEGSDLHRVSYPRPRIANAYLSWVSPDMKRTGVRKVYDDRFSAMMDDRFYWDWYKERRDDYARQAIALMRSELAELEREMPTSVTD